mmetsp:Transcript_58120/g.160913  ORF Transcript_58120/g.160913 Transcript_58120/m.160913 type:complete len:562 (+) Transcript_58120:426-2111(+)
MAARRRRSRDGFVLWLVLATCCLCSGDGTTSAAGATRDELAGAAQAMWSEAVAAANSEEWERVRGYVAQLRQLRAAGGLSEALAVNVDTGVETLLDFMANNNADVDVNPDAGWCTAAGGGEGSEYCSVIDDMATGAYGPAITKLLGLQHDKSLTPIQMQHVQRMMPQAYHGATSEASDSALQRNSGTNETFLSGAVDDALVWRETGGDGFVHHFYREDAVNGINGGGRKDNGGRSGSRVCAVESNGAGAGLGPEYWPPLPHPGNSSSADGEMLFGTVRAQRIIFDHQHPPAGCGPETKFLIAKTGFLTGHGIGSQFHILAANLALAMSLGRVLVLEPEDGNVFTKEARAGPDQEPVSSPFCNGVTSLECFIQPVSSCTAAHTRERSDGSAEWYLGPEHDAAIAHKKTVVIVGEKFKPLPPQMDAIWNCQDSPIAEDKRWYWWRSQAVAYLLRLNDRTREEIDRRTQLYFPVGSPPPGSISAHVRHGDKGLEMAVLPASDFLLSAEYLARRLPGLISHNIFVSTEDPEVVTSTMSWGAENGWAVYFTLNERANLPLYELFGR